MANATAPSPSYTNAGVVRVRNVGTSPFNQKYDGNRYYIPPDQEGIIPWDAMCLWFGHPEAVDIDKKHRYRSDELRRLHVKWGVYEKHNRAKETWIDEAGVTHEPLFPAMEVFDLDGNRIITVIDDPDGRELTPEVQTRAERDRLQEQMQTMAKQMDAMRAQMAEIQARDAADVAAGDTRTDEPAHRPEEREQIGPITPDPEEDGEEAEMDRPRSVKPVPRRSN